MAAAVLGQDEVPQPVGVETAKKEPEKQFWLNAWRDQLAGVCAFSNCLELSDVNGDDDYKLVVADAQRRLKVFGGTGLLCENALFAVPSAVASFYIDGNEQVRRPCIAVATGPFIFTYKSFRPMYRFTLPPVELAKEDTETWTALKDGALTADAAFAKLEAARDSGAVMSTRSTDFLALDNTPERQTFVEKNAQTPLVQNTAITCMTVLLKDKDEVGARGCLVIGTENRQVIILHNKGTEIIKKFAIPSAPVQLITAGLLDIEYRIIVACRNGLIYLIKNGALQATVIEPDAQVVAMARYDNQIAVATMSNSLHYYQLKGKKTSTLYMPCVITNVCSATMEATRQARAVIVAMANGELHVYAGKVLLNKIQLFDVVTGMKFGRYGREDATLALTLKSGTVMLKMLPRTTLLDASTGVTHGPPKEQDVPLKVPKRTNLYVEQTEREKQFAVSMHRVFQRDLCRLRLNTARAYVKMLTDGKGMMSYSSNSSIRLTAHVQGLGPLFTIRLNMQNTGTKALLGIPVVFTHSMTHYRIQRPYHVVPCLVPSLIYTLEVNVECVDDNAGSDVVRVCVCNPNSIVPIITALVNMPIADFLTGQ